MVPVEIFSPNEIPKDLQNETQSPKLNVTSAFNPTDTLIYQSIPKVTDMNAKLPNPTDIDTPYPTVAIGVKLTPREHQILKLIADQDGRSMTNYIRRSMQQYLDDLDPSALEPLKTLPPTRLKTSGQGKEKASIQVVVRLPRPLKESFYRVAELQGMKGATLIKKLIRWAYQSQAMAQ